MSEAAAIMGSQSIIAMLAQTKAIRVFDPQSPQARALFDLGIITTIILGLIFVIVGGLIVYAVTRFRQTRDESDPKQVAGNRVVELVWTAIPCLIVVLLFILAARTMGISDPPAPPDPDLVVIGHQWWWEARYPKSGVVTANEIHIPIGKAIAVRLDSSDVLHEFWVPELARKMTTVPGHPNNIWLQADQPGNYLGICSEFCGTQHAWMHFLIVAEPPEAFEAWEKAQLVPAAAPSNAVATRGMALFERTSCINCHTINGTGAVGRAGPDLTHFASRRQLGAGVVDNTRINLRKWLTDPQTVKPGVKMPDYKFNKHEIQELVEYVESLK